MLPGRPQAGCGQLAQAMFASFCDVWERLCFHNTWSKEGSLDGFPVVEGREISRHGISWVWTFSLILFHDGSCISVRVRDKVCIGVWNMAKLELGCCYSNMIICSASGIDHLLGSGTSMATSDIQGLGKLLFLLFQGTLCM